jgi:histidyl-tRNA synthetase
MSDSTNSENNDQTDMSVIGNIRGAEYIYPEQMARTKAIRSSIYEIARQWGYAQVDGPTLQPAEFYKIKASEELLKDGYYVSSGERTYMLRPEITPTIAYMLAQEERNVGYPVRWFSDPDLYRNERPQAGRRRQFGQFNIDRFDMSPMTTELRGSADAEVICVGIAILKQLGLTPDDIIVRINSRGLLEKVFDHIDINSQDERKKILALIDAKSKMSDDDFKKKLEEIGLGQSKNDDLFQWLSLASLHEVETDERFGELAKSEEYEELKAVFIWIDKLGYFDYVVYEPGIVRGLGYYTGTVFEVFDKFPDKSMGRAILGGGRYDNFTQKFGGKVDVSGVGFGMGHIPLETVLESRNLMPKNTNNVLDYYIVSIHESDDSLTNRLDDIMEVSRVIRRWGYSVVLDPSIAQNEDSKLKKQIGSADKLNAKNVLMFFDSGEDAANVVVKDLASGDQKSLSKEDFTSSIAKE